VDFLVFQLQAPLASWGDAAVGEYRGSINYPGSSALTGLLGAALGIRREDDEAHLALSRGYRIAVGMVAEGALLRDYHTAQVPPEAALKGFPHRTRRDELSIPGYKLKTILSTRDYRSNGSWRVAVQEAEKPPYTLSCLRDALMQPRFVLYLGRKSCPPAAPLDPRVIAADTALAAFDAYHSRQSAHLDTHKGDKKRAPLEYPSPIKQLAWPPGMPAGVEADLSTVRKDRLLRRSLWQFGDRPEQVAILTKEV